MGRKNPKGKETSSKTRLLFLSVKRTAHNMAQALGIRRLQDYLHGRGVLSGSPVWLLGKCYKASEDHDPNDPLPDEVQEKMIEDFASRLWMTYRSGFTDLGVEKFNSDVGWGCTIRSGQMLIAQAMLHHMLGRGWRRNLEDTTDLAMDEIWSVVGCFLDDDRQALSIHNICSVGEKFGVEAGRWLGPWVLSHVLEDLINSYRPQGLKVLLISQPGGGAPYINKARMNEYFAAFQEENGAASDCPQGKDSVSDGCPAAASYSRNDSSITDWELTDHNVGGSFSVAPQGKPGLVVLMPLVLGIEKVHEKYLPQLRAVMEWPQSLGIVGGRPSSSLYFIGYQGENIIYLDPHDDQEVALTGNYESYFCRDLRHMPISSIDPSLTIGFYCESPESLQDLVYRLERLEQDVSQGVPLVTVTDASIKYPDDDDDIDVKSDDDDEEEDKGASNAHGDDWELL
ncbi:hypothetical protein BSKO_08026 [Bryopsis sp. KO-2023]|nr:hypothetical protein BSKO_08026 [Bryopsis sp. KO-2023]